MGKAIFDLQSGETLTMPLSRPMPSMAAGVAELPVRGRDGNYKTFYYTRSARGILIFHAFVKKSQVSPRHELEIGRKHLKELLDEEN